jgi:hypothetical protein
LEIHCGKWDEGVKDIHVRLSFVLSDLDVMRSRRRRGYRPSFIAANPFP